MPAALHVIKHQVAGDRGEPRTHIPPLLVHRVDPPQRPRERLTGEVLNSAPVAEPITDEPGHPAGVPVIELTEGIPVTGLGGGD